MFFFVKFFLAELFSVRGGGDGLVPPKSGKEKFRPKTGSFCPKILILALFWTIIGRQFSAIFFVRRGGGPPFPLSFFLQNDYLLRGVGYPLKLRGLRALTEK